MAEQTELIYGVVIPAALGTAFAVPALRRARGRATTAGFLSLALLPLVVAAALWGAGQPPSFGARTVIDHCWIALLLGTLSAALMQRRSAEGRGLARDIAAFAVAAMVYSFIAVRPRAGVSLELTEAISYILMLFLGVFVSWRMISRPIEGDGAVCWSEAEGRLARLVPFIVAIPFAGTASLIALFSGTISVSISAGAIPPALAPLAVLSFIGRGLPIARGTAAIVVLVASAAVAECYLYAEVPHSSAALFFVAPLALVLFRTDTGSLRGRDLLSMALYGAALTAALAISATEYFAETSSGY